MGRLRYEGHEPRILYSADSVAGPVVVDHRLLQDGGELALANIVSQHQVTQQEGRFELVVIDTGVADWDFMKIFRHVATRFEKLDCMFLGFSEFPNSP